MINREKCAKCGQCVRVCPVGIFRQNTEEDYPEVKESLAERCVQCFHCMALCPVQAIEIEGCSYSSMLQAKPCNISREDMSRYLKNRRSIRNYSEELIPDDVFSELLNTAQWKSSAHNQHTVKWKIIRGKNLVKWLADEVIHLIEQDPRFGELVESYRNGNDPITRNASHILMAYLPCNSILPTEDGTIAMSYVEIMAPSFGLGACWSGYLTIIAQLIPEVKTLLEIPEDHTLAASLLIGYPDKEAYRCVPERRTPEISYLKQ